MNLTENSWHKKFYDISFYYNKKYPLENFCDYFWNLVLAFLLLPISWPSYVIQTLAKTNDHPYSFWGKVFGGGFLQCLFYIIIYHIINSNLEDWGVFFILILVTILSLALLIGIIYFFTDSDTGKELKEIVGEGIGSFKNKYCPKITWK